MQQTQLIGHAPRTAAIARDVLPATGPCLGCPDCRGLCHELIEAVTLPDAILQERTT